MMIRLKGKLPIFLFGTILLSMVWLGYWMGQMSHRSHINRLQAQLNKLESVKSDSNEQKENHLTSQRKHIKNRLGKTHISKQKTHGKDNVYVVDDKGAISNVNGLDEQDDIGRHHAISIHQSHANKISQHLNNVNGKSRKDNTQEEEDNLVRGVKPMVVGNDPTKPPDPAQKSESKVKPIFRDNKISEANKNENQGPEDVNHDNEILFPNKIPSKADVQAEIKFQELRKRLREERVVVKPTVKEKVEVVPDVKPFDPTGQYYALIHNGEAAKIHGLIHQKLKSIDNSVPKESYIFKSESLPRSVRQRPSIGNGHIGTAVHSSEVFVNGVYCGLGGESHRAVIPSTASFNITGTDPPTNFTRTYILNAGEGVYSEESISDSYSLTQRIYAHRKYSRLLIHEVDLVRKEIRTPLKLKVKLNRWTVSPDITFLQSPTEKGMEEVSYKVGHINAPESLESERPNIHIFYDHVPDTLVPLRGALRTKWVFITSIAKTKTEALEAYKLGARLAKSNDELYAEHIKSWASVWASGRIDVVGNLQLSQYIYGAYYYILSSMPLSEDPSSPFVGLSPSGLPFGEHKKDYQGHVFWDQETWMYPAILPLWPSLGRVLLNTRRRTMDAAKQNALKRKHKGLQYPWESAFTGDEVCPEEIFAEKEIHISGDISHAILQYIRATNDTSILSKEQKFGDILAGIADFYVSVLQWNETKNLYEIKGVVPPDEYQKNVNNSAYTNAIAKLSLKAIKKVYRRLNITVDRWDHMGSEIFIPYNLKEKYHPEFDGYNKGTKIKQADVVLLGFPLMERMDKRARTNDLKRYVEVTDVMGPAMSWSMYTIGWLELGDVIRAESLFKRNFAYIKNDFMVWNENALGDGATNFITGMGGFLQSVIYGYGGLRIRDDRLDLNPYLPLDCTEMHFTGINYVGSAFNIFIFEDSILVNLVEAAPSSPPLVLYVYKTEEVHSLNLNRPVRVPRLKVTITSHVTHKPGS